MEYDTAVRNDETIQIAATQMELEDMLIEVYQKKDKQNDVTDMLYLA